MENAVSGFFNAVTERMVMTFVVVVTHSGFVAWSLDGGFGFDFDFFPRNTSRLTLIFYVVGWLDASTVVAFSNVDFLVSMREFDVNLGFRISLGRLTISTESITLIS